MTVNFKVPDLTVLYSKEYDALQTNWRLAGAKDKAENIRRLCVGDNFSKVLEVGCGTGSVLEALAVEWKDTKFTGLEIGDERSVPRGLMNGRISIAKYDGNNIPFGDDAFDLAYATHVLEHVLDERRFLSELRRVAKRVYVEVPCELHLRTSVRSLQRTLEIGHINAYTVESFALKLETSGLRVDRFSIFDHSFDVHRFHSSSLGAAIKMFTRRSLLLVSPSLASRFLTYHVGAYCSRAPVLEF